MATSPNVTPDPRNATIASGKRVVQFATQDVQPPAPLLLQVEDSLTLTILAPTNLAAAQPILICRFLRPDGEIVLIRKTPPVVGDGWALNFTLGEGFLLSATVVINGLLVTQPGQFFAMLTIQRDLPETNGANFLLFSDYITATHFPSWPYGRQIQSQEGPGRIRTIVGTTPAAGAEISEAVPTTVRWRLLAFRFHLTTSAVAGNRNINFSADDGANIFYQSLFDTPQAASSTNNYQASNFGFAPGVGGGQGWFPWPDSTLLDGGYRLRTATNGLLAGDQYTAPTYLVEEWVNA